jgi:formate dehydrogenase maturation protein FdhE
MAAQRPLADLPKRDPPHCPMCDTTTVVLPIFTHDLMHGAHYWTCKNCHYVWATVDPSDDGPRHWHS